VEVTARVHRHTRIYKEYTAKISGEHPRSYAPYGDKEIGATRFRNEQFWQRESGSIDQNPMFFIGFLANLRMMIPTHSLSRRSLSSLFRLSRELSPRISLEIPSSPLLLQEVAKSSISVIGICVVARKRHRGHYYCAQSRVFPLFLLRFQEESIPREEWRASPPLLASFIYLFIYLFILFNIQPLPRERISLPCLLLSSLLSFHAPSSTILVLET